MKKTKSIKKLTHINASNTVQMVNVGDKDVTNRVASARAIVQLPPTCVSVLKSGGQTRKGNVFDVARLAGIMGAKRTSDLIPLCHHIPLSGVDIDMKLTSNRITITASAYCRSQTGVEMEALTAAAISALTIYDMLKAISHDIVIGPIELVSKTGGRSGVIKRRV